MQTIKDISTLVFPHIHSFRLRDNSVHLHEYSPLGRYFLLFFGKENYYVYCFM